MNTKTKQDIIIKVTKRYLNTLDVNNLPPANVIRVELITQTAKALKDYRKENGMRAAKSPQSLSNEQVAEIIIKLHNACMVSLTSDPNEKYRLLTIYQEDGTDEGLYSQNMRKIQKLINNYCYLTTDAATNKIIKYLHEKAPHKTCTINPDLIAVDNGIFDYKTKKLLPFSSEYVFVNKVRTAYNKHATNVVLNNDEDNTSWDVESWIESLSKKQDTVDTIWKVLSAIVRPNVKWNKMAWISRTKPCSGKGTLFKLMINLCGEKSCANINVDQFSKNYYLEPIVGKIAIINRHNDCGITLDNKTNMKAVITGDTILVNRKYKSTIAVQFHGFMVQGVPEFPKCKNNELQRRQLPIILDNSFINDERKYINQEYIENKQVLEYVLFKVLNTNFYEL